MEPDNQLEWQPINENTIYKPVVYFRQCELNLIDLKDCERF